jgi:hypothetical protein
MKDKKDKYAKIFNKIDHLSGKLADIREQIDSFKQGIMTCEFDDDTEEVCLDELESEAVLLEMVLNQSIEMIGESEPHGES